MYVNEITGEPKWDELRVKDAELIRNNDPTTLREWRNQRAKEFGMTYGKFVHQLTGAARVPFWARNR
jgi:hypothetical protein